MYGGCTGESCVGYDKGSSGGGFADENMIVSFRVYTIEYKYQELKISVSKS